MVEDDVVDGEVLDDKAVFEGELVVALYGFRGSGKTYRLLVQAIEDLKVGSRVVFIMNTKTQTIDVDAVARYLGDDSVAQRLVVVDNEDVLKPGFWPEERHALSTQWRNSTVTAGTRIYWDEAWDLLDNEATVEVPDPKHPGEVKPVKFWSTQNGRLVKRVLRKLRHWKGPADYRDPLTKSKVSDPTWSPERSEAEGDGVRMQACGLMVATQDYMRLNIEVRNQVEAVLHLRTYGTSMWKRLSGKYRELYIKGNQVPRKSSKQMKLLEAGPRWTIHEHKPEVHALIKKVAGNERSMLFSTEALKRSPKEWFMIVLSLGFIVGMIALAGSLVYDLFFKDDKKQPPKKPPTEAAGKPSSSDGSSGASGNGNLSRAAGIRVVGVVAGRFVMLSDGKRTWLSASNQFVRTEVGLVGSVDGEVVSEWTGSIYQEEARASDSGEHGARRVSAVEPGAVAAGVLGN